jgi:2-C-methyl-D-erythritol 2,4-cyclodiphosphate synthase
MTFRIGQGFDLHRLQANLPLMLGGLHIPFEKGSQGHSDGDVLLHAITDALLGALGLPDIGEFFPPGDPQWKHASSTVFIQKAMTLLKQAGYEIVNLDSSILLEHPKLGPYKEKIAHHVARLLEIQLQQVGIKAKTMEGLGDIGQGKAVAAFVNVLLQKKS